MPLVIPVDERIPPVAITDEEILIPASTPYQERLLECPSEDAGVVIRRIEPATKTGAGSGDMTSGGLYTGLATRSYKIEIDTAGDIGVAGATFKWYRDDVLQSSLIPIEDTDPITLELGVTVAFSEGAGTDFELGDYWEFDAEYWTEVTSIPIASMQFQVDYSNGMILFHSDDSGKTVYADYEGRGTVVKSGDLEQIIDLMNSGEVILGNMDTSLLTARDLVYISGSNALDKADASDDTKIPIGFVSEVDEEDGVVVKEGIVGGFVGLTPGAEYYMSTTAGEITVTPPVGSGHAIVRVGKALTAEQLLARMEGPWYHSHILASDVGDDHTQYALLAGRSVGQYLALGKKTSPLAVLDIDGEVAKSGAENLHTGGSSTTVTTTNDAFENIRIGAALTANGMTRWVIDKSDSNTVTVNSAVDWDNGGTGYAFTYKNPLFAFSDDTADRVILRADGEFMLSGLTPSKPVFTDALKGLTSSGIVPVDQGGTGLASYAIGDLIYASAETTLSKLADVAVGSYLRSGGVNTAPLWSTLTLPDSATLGDILYASGANAIGNLVDVAVGQVLVSGGVGSAPAWSANPYISGNLGIGINQKLSRLTIVGRSSFSATGTVTKNATTTIAGDGTSFLTEIGIGDRISIPGGGGTDVKTVTAIASDVSLTVATATTYSASGQTATIYPGIFRVEDYANAVKFVVSDQGNVGIGTMEPLAKLQVSGGYFLLDNNQPFKMKNTEGSHVNVLFLDNANNIYFGNNQDENIYILGGTDYPNARIFIDAGTGGIGFGTSTPIGKQHAILSVIAPALFGGDRTGAYTSVVFPTANKDYANVAGIGTANAVGNLLIVTGGTGATQEIYQIIAIVGADSVQVDRNIHSSGTNITDGTCSTAKDVVAGMATDGVYGNLWRGFSAQNKPWQLGGHVLAATSHSLVSRDILIGNSLEVDGILYADAGIDVASGQVYKLNNIQVIGARVIDERIDDAINESAWDATTAGVLDALRDAAISHGLIAAST
jgi:hypothetical protein